MHGIKKFLKGYWKPIVFIFLPFLISILISLQFEYILNFERLTVFMTISSWFFSLSGLILIFLVSEKFRVSIFHKNIRDKKFLDTDGIIQLKNAVKGILLVADNKKDINQLSNDCRTIKYIYQTLTKQKQDTELYSLKEEIGELFSKINRYKLESIGDKGFEEWEKFSDSHKREVGEIAYVLEQGLEQLLQDIENR